MKQSARLREIGSLLREREEVTVEEVCLHFGISPATARRDFVALAESGKAEKTWGGLRVLDPQSHPMLPSGTRQELYSEEKRRIAARAVAFCNDGDIVFIDGGTTTLQLARWFADRPLRIVTNSLLIAYEIDRLRSGPGGAEVFLTGGYLYPGSGLLVGPEATASLQKYQAKTAFLSVGGIGEEGISNNHHLVVEVERAMISRAEQVVLLADHSKFGRRELMPECQWGEVHALITDRPPPDRYLAVAGDRLVIA